MHRKKKIFKSLISSKIRRDIASMKQEHDKFFKKRTKKRKGISCILKRILIEIQKCKIKFRKNCSENRAKY